MRSIIAFLLALVSSSAFAQNQPPAPPDPFVLNDTLAATATIYRQALGVTPRQITINPAQKTLVLLIAGQSQMTGILPTLYTPTNTSVISHMNIYDGAFYPITAPLLGTNYTTTLGPGAIPAEIADNLINGGDFNTVLLVVLSVGGTSMVDWSSTGTLYQRSAVAMKRLAAQGITPGMTGVTFGFLWSQGENEGALGTSQSSYTSNFNSMSAALTATGFTGKRFVCEETLAAGATYAPVQAAQLAAVDGVTWFSGGNLDAIGNRQGDGTHANNTGGAQMATAIYNALHAAGY